MAPAGFGTDEGIGYGPEVALENDLGNRNAKPGVAKTERRNRTNDDGMEDGEIQDEDGEVFEELDEESVHDVDNYIVELDPPADAGPSNAEVQAQQSQGANEASAKIGSENLFLQDEIDSYEGTDMEDRNPGAGEPSLPKPLVGSWDGYVQHNMGHIGRGCPSRVPQDTRLVPAQNLDASISAGMSIPHSTQQELYVRRHPYAPHRHRAGSTLQGHVLPPIPHQVLHMPPPLPLPHLFSVPPHHLPGFFEQQRLYHPHRGNDPDQKSGLPDDPPYASTELSLPPFLFDRKPDGLRSQFAEHSDCDTTRLALEYGDHINALGTGALSHGMCVASVESEDRSVHSRSVRGESLDSLSTNYERRSSPTSSAEGRETSRARNAPDVHGSDNVRTDVCESAHDLSGGIGKRSQVPARMIASSEQRCTASSSESHDVNVPTPTSRRPRMDLAAMKLAALKTLKRQNGPSPKSGALQFGSETEKIVFSCDEEESDSGIESESDDSSSGAADHIQGDVKGRQATVSAKPNVIDVQAVPVDSSAANVATADVQVVKRRELEELRKLVKLKEEELAIKALQYGALVTPGRAGVERSTPPSTKGETPVRKPPLEEPSSAKKLIEREKQNLVRKIAELERMRRDAIQVSSDVPSELAEKGIVALKRNGNDSPATLRCGRRGLNEKRVTESSHHVLSKRPRFCGPLSKSASRTIHNSLKDDVSRQEHGSTVHIINGTRPSSAPLEKLTHAEVPPMTRPSSGDKVRPVDNGSNKSELEMKHMQLTAANQKLRVLKEARVLVTEAEVAHARALAKLDAVRENICIWRERFDAALVEEARLVVETRKLRAVAERMRKSWLDNLREGDEDTDSGTSAELMNKDIAVKESDERDNVVVSDLASLSYLEPDHQYGTQSVSVLAPSPFTPRPLEHYTSPLIVLPLFLTKTRYLSRFALRSRASELRIGENNDGWERALQDLVFAFRHRCKLARSVTLSMLERALDAQIHMTGDVGNLDIALSVSNGECMRSVVPLHGFLPFPQLQLPFEYPPVLQSGQCAPYFIMNSFSVEQL